EKVPLDAQLGDIPYASELPVPRDRVRQCCSAQPFEALVVERGLRRLDEIRDPGVETAQVQRARRRSPAARAPPSEPDEVVRPPGLGARADGGALPAAERLPLHDRAGDAAVHV